MGIYTLQEAKDKCAQLLKASLATAAPDDDVVGFTFRHRCVCLCARSVRRACRVCVCAYVRLSRCEFIRLMYLPSEAVPPETFKMTVYFKSSARSGESAAWQHYLLTGGSGA